MRHRNPAFEQPHDRELFWKTKDGTLIPLAEMEETHLKNCIAFFQRRGGSEELWRPLQKELDFRRFINNERNDT